MPEPTDNTGAWIERLLEVAGRQRYDRLSGMTPEEEHALVLRLLGDRERFIALLGRTLRKVNEALDALDGSREDIADYLGWPKEGA